MKIGLHYKDNRKVFEEKEIEQVPFLQYPLFENTNPHTGYLGPGKAARCDKEREIFR